MLKYVVLVMYNVKKLNRVRDNVMMMKLSYTLAAIAMVMITITIVESSSVSQAQQLTPEQKAAMCAPNNPRLKFVNSTESEICGIPKTPTNQTNSTTPTAAPSKSLTPSATNPSKSLTPSATNP
jgi:hypothetical protein